LAAPAITSTLLQVLTCSSGKLVEAKVQLNHNSASTASEKLAALKLQPHVAILLSRQCSRPQIDQLLTRLRSKSSRSYKSDSKMVKKLHEGIDNGDYAAVYKCLCDRADPNALYKTSSKTPIHRALSQAEAALGCEDEVASRDLLSIITILTLAGANMTATDENQQTPLIRAVKGEMGDSLVALMLEFGARVNATDKEQNTALHYAAMRHASAEMKNVEVIRMLLVFGADQSIRNLRGRTALYKAVMYEDVGRTTELLNYGADLEIADNNLWTALCAAVLQGNLSLTRVLCERGAFVDKKDKTGQTALHYAVSQGRHEILEILVSHGADVNLISKGETPLCRATSKSNAALIRSLLKHGADVTVPSPGYNGALPVHLAAIGKDADILNLLLDAGSPANALDDMGRTPRGWAMDVNKTEFVNILMSRGG
jgi:ankyrin repeat protein